MTELLEIASLLGMEPRAALFGAAGLICQLTWPLMRTRPSILAVQMGIGAGYGIQYAFLGAWSGTAICFLGASQTVIALIAGDRPGLRKLGLVFLPLVWVLAFATWAGISSLFALAACSLTMLGRLQSSTVALRGFMLGAAPFGISYDVSVGAGPALCGAVTSATLSAVILMREVMRRREGDGELAYLAAAGLLV
jgi:hypothetical protein